jgi:hypothetical protein
LDRLPGKPSAQHIPRVCRDRTAGANHPRHLGNAFGRIRNKKDHQRHDGGIEPIVGERQRHRVALEKFRPARRWPGAGESELCFRRIDRLRLGRSASLDEQFGEGAAAAADIDPPHARAGLQPIEEELAREPAPDAHRPLINISVIEMDRLFDH